jgi:sugar phosphate isomerase/epimerase
MRRHRIGVMQGRLSPRPADRLQAFPQRTWAHEFRVAQALGFDFIEWIYEADRHTENPLASAQGRAEIRAISRETGLRVLSVCGDYFMVHRLATPDGAGVDAAVASLLDVVRWTQDIGAQRILLPLLETSACDTPELKAQVVKSLRRTLPELDRTGIVLGLEMEIPGPEYRELIDRVGHPRVRAYYDTGNSTAQGQDIGVDIQPLLPCLEAVHIKDRVVHGSSRELGTGAANFAAFFAALAQSGFRGDFLLQHYFDSEPEAAARRGLEFVTHQLERARGAAA